MNTRTALLNPETPPAYEPISIGLTESDITATMNSFMEFLQLPYEERVKVVFVDESRPRTGVSGYQHKGHASPDGSRQQDNKHIFHMTQTLHEAYGSHTRRLPHEARVFLRAAYSIHSALSAAAKRKYQELGATYLELPISSSRQTVKIATTPAFLPTKTPSEAC